MFITPTTMPTAPTAISTIALAAPARLTASARRARERALGLSTSPSTTAVTSAQPPARAGDTPRTSWNTIIASGTTNTDTRSQSRRVSVGSAARSAGLMPSRRASAATEANKLP